MRRIVLLILFSLYSASFFLPVGTSVGNSSKISFGAIDSVRGYQAAVLSVALMLMFIKMGPTTAAAKLFGVGVLFTASNLFMLVSAFYFARRIKPPRPLQFLAILAITGAIVPIVLPPFFPESIEISALSIGYFLWGVSVASVAALVLWDGIAISKSAI